MDPRHSQIAHVALEAAGAYGFALAGGYVVTLVIRNDTFTRLLLDEQGAAAEPLKLELSADWRAHPPVTLAVGPVLHRDDAAANKMCALFGRAEARDFLDIDAVIRSEHYTRAQLIALAGQADAGFAPTASPAPSASPG